jgi:hypothetical protein
MLILTNITGSSLFTDTNQASGDILSSQIVGLIPFHH